MPLDQMSPNMLHSSFVQNNILEADEYMLLSIDQLNGKAPL